MSKCKCGDLDNGEQLKKGKKEDNSIFDNIHYFLIAGIILLFILLK